MSGAAKVAVLPNAATITTEPVVFDGSPSARQPPYATIPERMMARNRMPAVTIHSGRKVMVARLEKMTAGSASSVTRRSKTGWWLSLKTPLRLRTRIIRTIRMKVMTNWYRRVFISVMAASASFFVCAASLGSCLCSGWYGLWFSRSAQITRKDMSGMVTRLTR